MPMNWNLKNWENCCKFQADIWHGTWTTYSPSLEILKVVNVITSLELNSEQTEIHHVNYNSYADGTKEEQDYGRYTKDNCLSSLFLENTFSWGGQQLEAGSGLFMQIGFRHENQRTRFVTQYDESYALQTMKVIREQLSVPPSEPAQPSVENLSGVWQGNSVSMTPDLQVSEAIAIQWQGFDSLGEQNRVFFFPDGISLSCPLQLAIGEAFTIAVGWLLNSTQHQRVIRQFDDQGNFTSLTLETLRRVS
ncbi:DUF3598 family protein [Microcoleus sp. FACHB-672]|uniref:DUF3598 family protein n=1 Tax=Microcoleus sp. FACHB-672 TaxID=2692825 RepID=UPI001688F4A4|nr:DUF3598 family protein [Microcoleus sp. FACHB-672]MBD2039858.1 DUF3598 family protein [Microcoleus sp. FACHB-672]